MTTAQIVIYLVLFIFDLSLSVNHIKKYDPFHEYESRTYVFTFQLLRFVFTWGIIVALTFEMNRLSSPNPCPQLEKVENVYKIK